MCVWGGGGGGGGQNTLLRKDKDLSTSRLFSSFFFNKSVPDDKRSNTQYSKNQNTNNCGKNNNTN